MKFQVCSTDEYGQNTIWTTCDKMEEVYTIITDKLNEANMDNALTEDEQINSWEAYFPVVLDKNEKIIQNIIFGGRDTTGKYFFYVVKSDNTVKQSFESIQAAFNVRFYLGQTNKIGQPEKYNSYLKTLSRKRQEIYPNQIPSEYTQDKTVFFVYMV